MNQQTFRSISPFPLPADFDYIPNSDDGLGQTTIAPKAVIDGFHHAIPVDVLQQVKSGEKYVYIWGWADYDDVFDNTPRRRSEFCFSVEVLGDLLAENCQFRFPRYGSHHAYPVDTQAYHC